MRGIYHRSSGIETFLEKYPVPITSLGTNVYFEGKATMVFESLLNEGPGLPPTVDDFIGAYMQDQPSHLRQLPGSKDRMVWIYIGLMRDYHTGALLIECPAVTHLFWSALLDADGGVDYIMCVNQRYAALHVQTDDPKGWTRRKQIRKSGLSECFPYHANLIVPRKVHTKGNIWLCRPCDVAQLAQQVGREGALRPADTRVWSLLKMQTVRFIGGD